MYTVKRMGEITIDGMVNEAAWMVTDSITEFYQTQPNPGYTATERTVVRILYDEDYLYVSAILYDSEPEKIIIESLEQELPNYLHQIKNKNSEEAKKQCYTKNLFKKVNYFPYLRKVPQSGFFIIRQDIMI